MILLLRLAASVLLGGAAYYAVFRLILFVAQNWIWGLGDLAVLISPIMIFGWLLCAVFIVGVFRMLNRFRFFRKAR